jgi:transposase InsO family protein
VPWIPFSVVQRWPFCWWVGIVFDHFSRAVVAKAVFRKEPTGSEICELLDRAVERAGRALKYTITDQGVQFGDEYRAWCAEHGVRPRYGAVGQHGSIAVLERFMKTLKDEGLRRIVVPFRLEEMVREVDLFVDWYNTERPHMSLRGATPSEIERGVRSARDGPRFETRKSYPTRDVELRADAGTAVELCVRCCEGRAHLPVIEVRAAA